MLSGLNKTLPKQANPSTHHSNINNKRGWNTESEERNGTVGKGKREKEYEKTNGKKSDYERRTGKRATTCNELKEENGEKEHRKGNKNNKR